jgi:hypothetical protein
VRTAYRLALVVDDHDDDAAIRRRADRLVPPAVALAVQVAVARLLAGGMAAGPPSWPTVGAVAVATHPTEGDDLDPCGGCPTDPAAEALTELAAILDGPAPTLAKVAGVLRQAGVQVVANPGRRRR